MSVMHHDSSSDLDDEDGDHMSVMHLTHLLCLLIKVLSLQGVSYTNSQIKKAILTPILLEGYDLHLHQRNLIYPKVFLMRNFSFWSTWNWRWYWILKESESYNTNNM
ncbi:hypothetical protein QL285_013561 [Trifolium repens]|nr:hypothetical protein QL285_013561 [Trifolium repens]